MMCKNFTGGNGLRGQWRLIGKWVATALIVLAFILAGGCVSEDQEVVDSQPHSDLPDFSGLWAGTLHENTSGNYGELTLTINQNAESLSGTWTATFPTITNGGSLQGDLSEDGQTASFKMNPSDASFCAISATVALTPDEAQGNYASVDCHYTQTGTIHVFRDGGGYSLPVPGAPLDLTAAPGDGEVTMSWSSVSYATSYNLYWSNTPGVSPSTGMKISGVANPFTHSGLTNGTAYY